MHLGQLQVIVHSAWYEITSARLLLSCWQNIVLCAAAVTRLTKVVIHRKTRKASLHESI